MVTYERYQFGGYLLINLDNDDDIYFQSDIDFPSLAKDFGWSGEENDIAGAIKFLDDNEGIEIEDSFGYFDN